MNIKENLSTEECEVFLWQDNFPSSEDDQCALMDKLFVQFWSFSAMKICPIAFKINQSKFKILPNTKWTLSKWPKFLASSQSVEILPHMVTQKAMPCFMLKDKTHYFLVSDQGQRRLREKEKWSKSATQKYSTSKLFSSWPSSVCQGTSSQLSCFTFSTFLRRRQHQTNQQQQQQQMWRHRQQQRSQQQLLTTPWWWSTRRWWRRRSTRRFSGINLAINHFGRQWQICQSCYDCVICTLLEHCTVYNSGLINLRS